MAATSSTEPGADLLTALLRGRTAVQGVGTRSLGEGLLDTDPPVEAAGQAEPQRQAQPVRFAERGRSLTGKRLSVPVAPLRVEGENHSVTGCRCHEPHLRSRAAGRG
ncbi:MAG TPA: hypothetical protein DD420_31200, partial [Streptomyces sp.]|nr:hypothetical protein [Streptomyces sp.]